MKRVKIFKHLKLESYYNDLYDKFTVEECRRTEKSLSNVKYKPEPKNNKKSNKKELKVTVNLSPTPLYFIKGERYLEKAKTIGEWMGSDRAKDELLESAEAPKVQCLKCGSNLIPGFKHLDDGWPDKKDRVLFMYDCPKGCLPRRAFFNTGEEWKSKPHLCIKCNSQTEEKNSKKGKIITSTYTCLECGHKEKDILDLGEKPKPEKPDPYFERDRKRFCLSDEEGSKYVSYEERLKHFSETMKELTKKAEIEKKISKIKKLTVAQLRKKLNRVLEKEDYLKLDFSKPEIGREIIINFIVQDNEENRGEYDSGNHLKRTIKKALEKTNWRLMSEGVYYRLGILTGRLKGYESEEDLLRLVKN